MRRAHRAHFDGWWRKLREFQSCHRSLVFLDGRRLSLRFDTYYDDTKAELSRGIAGLRYSNPSFTAWDLSHTHDLRFEKIDLSTYEFDLDRISFSSALARSQENGIPNSINTNEIGSYNGCIGITGTIGTLGILE